MAIASRTGDVDVIVAGVGAAAELRALGRRCVALEASARVGGRAWTDTPPALNGAPFDHGASWLHNAERNPLVDIARAHGDDVRSADGQRERRVYVGGRIA